MGLEYWKRKFRPLGWETSLGSWADDCLGECSVLACSIQQWSARWAGATSSRGREQRGAAGISPVPPWPYWAATCPAIPGVEQVPPCRGAVSCLGSQVGMQNTFSHWKHVLLGLGLWPAEQWQNPLWTRLAFMGRSGSPVTTYHIHSVGKCVHSSAFKWTFGT